MAKVTIYLPDGLAERVKASGITMSPVCQRALQEEVAKMQVVQALKAQEERIVVQVAGPDETPVEKAFFGTWLVHADPDVSNDRGYYFGVALTRRSQIAVYVQHINEMQPPELLVYSSLDEAEDDGVPQDVLAAAGRELGESRPIELDI